MNRQKRNSSAVNDNNGNNHDDDPTVNEDDITHHHSNNKENTTADRINTATTVAAARGRKNAETSTTTSTGAAEAGIIKSIYCENFMCHTKLTVDLNRNVTFIHGQNGSGTYYVSLVLLCVFIFRYTPVMVATLLHKNTSSY